MKPFLFAKPHCGLLAVAIGCLCGMQNLWADAPQAFFQTYCTDCHGADSQEADLRLDTLSPPTADMNSQATWTTIMQMIDTQ